MTSVRILNNPAHFTDPLQFEIEYECLVNLQDDLEWSVTYVGSAEADNYDQTLESVAVGPVAAGNFRFTLEANPPDHTLIPPDDVVGVTVLILTCKYRNQEFIRIGECAQAQARNTAGLAARQNGMLLADTHKAHLNCLPCAQH